jgi:DNA polymerase-4
MSIFREIAALVEPLSLDEAYLDVTESVTPTRPPALIARELKARVKAELGLTISVGVATSKSVAKVASDMDKPDGLTVVPPGSEREFLAPLPAEKLWGIGPKTSARLAAEGVHTIGDLVSKGDEWLRKRLGRTGPHMRRLAQGQDDSPVVTSRDRKSVSAESTMAQDTDDPDALEELVQQLSRRVGRVLERRSLEGRTVKLKLRLADFTTFTRQKTVPRPVQTPEEIAQTAGVLLRAELWPGRMFRLVGVGVSGFDAEPDEVIQPRLAGFE